MALDVSELVSDLPVLVPFAQAAAFLGVSVRTLRSYIASGRIAAFKYDARRAGKVVIPRGALAKFLETAQVRAFHDFLPAPGDGQRA